MICYHQLCATLDLETVLREWVLRETRKKEYPDAEPGQWDEERLISELGRTYDEPVQYATFRAPAWTKLIVSGSELGKFDPYPSIGWNWVNGGKTLAAGIDRMQSGDLDEDAPLNERITTFCRQFPDHEFGALVVRQFEECWPPVTLDGNHRALAAILAAREGLDVELTVHLGHETPLDKLPLKKDSDVKETI